MAAQIPARVKFRKMHRGSRAGTARKGHTVVFGQFGLQAMERCWLSTRQIEAARQTITRTMKRRGKLWIRVFPQKSYSKKPLEVRMGKGKANVLHKIYLAKTEGKSFKIDTQLVYKRHK